LIVRYVLIVRIVRATVKGVKWDKLNVWNAPYVRLFIVVEWGMDALVAEREDTVDIAEAMFMLGISRSTLYKRMADGEISPVPEEGTTRRRRLETRFMREDVERLRDNPPKRGE